MAVALEQLVRKTDAADTTSEVSTEALLERLQERIPSVKSERSKALGLVSEIFGIKQKYRGKAKRYILIDAVSVFFRRLSRILLYI